LTRIQEGFFSLSAGTIAIVLLPNARAVLAAPFCFFGSHDRFFLEMMEEAPGHALEMALFARFGLSAKRAELGHRHAGIAAGIDRRIRRQVHVAALGCGHP